MNIFSKLPLAIAITATAQSALAETTKTEHMLVTATRSEQPGLELPANIKLISAEEIARSGVSNIAELLSSQAGIQINDQIGNGSRSSISMRGFGAGNAANNVLVIVDGRRLNNPSQASADLSSISLKDVDRIEILQGSAGVLYGDQATGGVINVITKQPDEFSANLEAGRGSWDWETYSGSASQKFKNGLSYRISGEEKSANNFRKNNESNYSNYLGLVEYEADNWSVFAELQSINDDLQLPGELSLVDSATDRRQVNSTKPNDFSNRETDTYRIGGERQLTQEWKIIAEYTHRDTDGEGILSNGAFTSYTDVTTFNPRLVGEIETASGNMIITLGSDIQDSEYFLNSAFGTTDHHQDMRDYYGQIIYPATETVSITAGARHSDMDEVNRTTGNDNDNSETLTSLGLNWQVSENTRIFTRRDEGIRWANGDDQALFASNPEFLNPQLTTSYEIGVEHSGADYFLSVLVYDMDVEDEIYYEPASFLNVNLDDSNRQGVVLDGTFNISKATTLSANFSYVDAEYEAGTFKGNTVPFVAEIMTNFSINHDITEKVSIYVDVQYTGNRYRSGDDANAGGELGGYTIFNANIRWEENNWYSQLRVNNLTNKKYEGFSGTWGPGFEWGYPSPETNAQLTVGYKF